MTKLVCADISRLDRQAYGILLEKASPLRRQRAEDCRFREDALRCLAAEALVCYILGSREYTWEQEPGGKPRIRELPGFQFNLSHSGDWVVLAYGDSPVGVDVQQHRKDRDIAAFARRFFTPEEQSYVFGPEADPTARFYEVWTGKESWLKYLGTGLTKPLASFSILQPEPGICFHHRQLPGGYSLSLCCREEAYTMEILEGRYLL